jgi:teichuronic acid biosynthesis glycosyltransferase TuaH
MDSIIIKERDIIIVGQQPWDVPIGSNCKNIALEFCKHNRVLYVNSPLDRISSIRDRNDPAIRKRLRVIKGKEDGLVQLQADLWNLYPDCMVESLNWISNPSLFDWINKRNNRKFANSIKKAAKKLRFHNCILFNDNEIMKCFYLKELLKPAISIYYSRDYILATNYWKKHGWRLEPLVIASNDLCVANSTYLTDYCKKYNPNAYYVGQGCEVDMFLNNNQEVPTALKSFSSPLIGYVGALLASRLDADVIADIAVNHPEWNIILVGPEDEAFRNNRLHQLKNIVFTGAKPATELPAYIAAFDVCINPQILNQLTIGNYPRKIDEYLAMGKPVVATRTKAMETFESYVYLADNKEVYSTLIEKALSENTAQKKEERKAFAAMHTWENSVAEIYKSIGLVENQYQPSGIFIDHT